jgi:hypothetical protein
MILPRIRAAGIHFTLSLLVATLVFLAVYFVWYPDALFDKAGGKELFFLIAAVDVTLGPLITLVIFKPGKKGLKFDLVTIVAVQLIALSYGVWVLYESRPVYLVFVKDRFELARANDIEPAELAKAKAPYDRLPLTGPRIVGARLPTDPEEQFRVTMSAAAGLDMQGFPQYFVAYDEVKRDVLAKASPFAALRKYNADTPGAVERVAKRLGARPESSVRILPLRSGKSDLTVLIDAATADVLYIADVKPWEFR